MKKLRIVVLVSSDGSDIYLANQLIKNLNVVGVFVEKQYGYPITLSRIVKILLKFTVKPWLLIKKISDYINQLRLKPYDEKASKIDLEQFGEERKKLFPDKNCKVVYTEGIKAINEPVYVKEIKRLNPDLIAVCGCSILKKAIISIPPKGVLNLHGGLSQKYRGVWTTLWSVYHEEPEYIGATVHYVSPGIDDGNIIYQGRPDIVDDDNPESLYVKVVKLGTKLMLKAINDIQNNTVKSYPLEEKGALYLEKMVTPEVIRKAWENIEAGVIHQYLEKKAVRDKKVMMLLQGNVSK